MNISSASYQTTVAYLWHSLTTHNSTPLYPTLHNTTYTTTLPKLHFTTLHYALHCTTSLHYTTLHDTARRYLHCTALPYTTRHYTARRYLHCTALPYTTRHSATLHYTTLHFTTTIYPQNFTAQLSGVDSGLAKLIGTDPKVNTRTRLSFFLRFCLYTFAYVVVLRAQWCAVSTRTCSGSVKCEL